MKNYFLLLLLCTIGVSAQDGRLIPNPIRKIPKWVRTEWMARHLDERYAILYKLYPVYLKGDFNGDGRRDVAVQVQEIQSGKIGLAIFHAKKPQAAFLHMEIVGAGKTIGKAGDNLKNTGIWTVYPRRGGSGGEAVNSLLTGDAIELKQSDGKSGLVFWNGKQYAWQWE